MAAVNNIKPGNDVAFVTAGESVTSRLDDIAKKALKGRSKMQDPAVALPAGYLPAERSLQRLMISIQGGSAKHSQNLTVPKSAMKPAKIFDIANNVEITKKTKIENSKLNPVPTTSLPVMPLIHNESNPVLPTELASKDSSGVILSTNQGAAVNNKSQVLLSVKKTNEQSPKNSIPVEKEKPHEQLSSRDIIRHQVVNTQPHSTEHTAKELTQSKALIPMRMPANMQAGTLSDDATNKSPASARLTYTFSDWGKGHQVNVQMSAHNGSPVVLSPSDSVVHQRLANHGEHHHQGNPEWVFSDEQEKQHPGQQRQQNQDEEQA